MPKEIKIVPVASDESDIDSTDLSSEELDNEPGDMGGNSAIMITITYNNKLYMHAFCWFVGSLYLGKYLANIFYLTLDLLQIIISKESDFSSRYIKGSDKHFLCNNTLRYS